MSTAETQSRRYDTVDFDICRPPWVAQRSATLKHYLGGTS